MGFVRIRRCGGVSEEIPDDDSQGEGILGVETGELREDSGELAVGAPDDDAGEEEVSFCAWTVTGTSMVHSHFRCHLTPFRSGLGGPFADSAKDVELHMRSRFRATLLPPSLLQLQTTQ